MSRGERTAITMPLVLGWKFTIVDPLNGKHELKAQDSDRRYLKMEWTNVPARLTSHHNTIEMAKSQMPQRGTKAMKPPLPSP